MKRFWIWQTAFSFILVALVISGCAKREAVTETPLPMEEGLAPGVAKAVPPPEEVAPGVTPGVPPEAPPRIREERLPEAPARPPIGPPIREERFREEKSERPPGIREARPEEAVVARIPEREVAAIPKELPAPLRDIYFDFDKYDLKEDSRKTLQEIADWLMKNLNVKIQIEGHADERGTDEYNLALGDRRADAALRYLVSLGVGRERMTTISYGEWRPADPGHNEEAWAKNRRAHFVVISR